MRASSVFLIFVVLNISSGMVVRNFRLPSCIGSNSTMKGDMELSVKAATYQ